VSAKLNDLRNALGDLKIIDVVRKPAGLSADLKAEEAFAGDREAVTSLAQRGFFAVQKGDMVSSNGETVIGMKDGVEYLLRFGNGTTVSGDGTATQEAAPADGAGASPDAEATGRYLFVTARFNEGLLEKPALDPLPEPPAGADAATPDGDKDKQDADAKEATDAGDAKVDGAADELKKAEEAEAKAQAALEERRRVEAENRRKQEQYDEQVKGAEKKVRDLNNRFADWYYVVSDKEYDKIHLAATQWSRRRNRPPTSRSEGDRSGGNARRPSFRSPSSRCRATDIRYSAHEFPGGPRCPRSSPPHALPASVGPWGFGWPASVPPCRRGS